MTLQMPSLQDALKRRLQVLEACNHSLETRAMFWSMCQRDPVFWINTFVTTHDPRQTPTFLPMILFPKQEAMIRWIEERESKREFGLIEKSRDVGASWVAVCYLLHHWLFLEGFVGAIGSRKLEYIDSLNDPKSMFERMRILIRRLPFWMQPSNTDEAPFNMEKHSSRGKLVNPLNDAVITGEGGEEIGRGGRSSLYFVDEAAFIPRSHMVDAALSENSECVIGISTPNGMSNSFASKRHGGLMPVFTMHWKDDPRKNKYLIRDSEGVLIGEGHGYADGLPDGVTAEYPWYEERRRRHAHNPKIVAQELDLNYADTDDMALIRREWIEAAITIDLPAVGESIAGFDPSGSGANNNALAVRIGPVFVYLNQWLEHSGDPGDAMMSAIRQMARHDCRRVIFDSGGVGAGIDGVLRRSGLTNVQWLGVQAGSRATESVWPDGRRSHEMFLNLKTELAYRLRERFRMTYLHSRGDQISSPERLIKIPRYQALIDQLLQLRTVEMPDGRIRMETKEAMEDRGIPSPDLADAVMLCERIGTARMSSPKVATR